MKNILYRLTSLITVLSLVLGELAFIPASFINSDNGTKLLEDANSDFAASFDSPADRWLTRRPQAGCYWADLDCDHDIDTADLNLMAEYWDCATGESCYEPVLDHDANGVINVMDLAALGNEYDIEPPSITITSPTPGQVLNTSPITINGWISDQHPVTAVTINGVGANMAGNTFTASIPLDNGSQALATSAEDALGAITVEQMLVSIDTEGPLVNILLPKDSQSVYTLQPAVHIAYTDFFGQVNPASLVAQLTDTLGNSTNVTSDLAAGQDEATGTLAVSLTEGESYTMTVTIADTAGNLSQVQGTFFVAGALTAPTVPETAGWVSGVVYDSTTCEGGQEQPVYCHGVPGATVNLSLSGEPNNPLAGTVVTGPEGFFAFPVATTEQYWLRVEKDGYTYGQREAEIVLEQATPVNEIFVTPLDPTHVQCAAAGCTLTSSDGMLKVEIPPGAITGRDVVDTSATFFDQVEFLPSGGLPEGTWETFAFNLGGDSVYQFALPITVTVKNTLGFAPGVVIPLGYWNQETQLWEHAGTSIVDDSGETLTFTTTHFSVFDCNMPVTVSPAEIILEPELPPGDVCPAGVIACSKVDLQSGVLHQDFSLPPVIIAGQAYAPTFLYDSSRADPSEVIEIRFSLGEVPGVIVGDYVQAELYIQGEKTDNFTFALESLGENQVIGNFRYFWDGRDAQGNRLPTGMYSYDVRVRLPYQGQYYMAANNIFGGPPDYTRPTGIWVNATAEKWLHGTVALAADLDNPLGIGWTVEGMERLYEDEAGHVLVHDSHVMDEYYFPGKDLLMEAALRGEQRKSENRQRVTSIESMSNELTSNESMSTEGLSELPNPQLPITQLPIPELPNPQFSNPNSSAHQLLNSSTPPQLPTHQLLNSSTPLQLPNYQIPSPPSYSIRTPQDTHVSGAITSNTTWTLANSPYILDSSVTVNAGVSLTIEPGVTVQGSSSTRLYVLGTLNAVGTSGSPILFTSLTNTAGEQWQGIVFDGGAGHLQYVTIRYAGQYNGILNTALTINNSTALGVVVEDSTFEYSFATFSSDYGVYINNSHVAFHRNTIQNNGNSTAYEDRAMYVTGTSTMLEMTGNILQNNQRNTVWMGSAWQEMNLEPQAVMQGFEFKYGMTIPAGYTMTVQAGTTVVASAGVAPTISGYIESLGTPTLPVTFTSLANTGPEQWNGLGINGGTAHFQYTTFQYGGAYNNLLGRYSVLTVNDVTDPAGVLLENCTIQNNRALYSTDHAIWVENSIFEMRDSLLTNNGNSVWDHTVGFNGNNNTITLENNTLTGNQRDTVMLYQAWLGMSLVPQAQMLGYELAGGFTVPVGYTMTLQAGVTVVADADVAPSIRGHIESLGTPTLPVTFTSFLNTGPEQWNGLGINGGTAHFQYTIFQYGGLYNNLAGRYSVLTVNNVTDPAGVLLENCTIQNNRALYSTDHAIWVENSIFEMRDSLLTNNGNSVWDHTVGIKGNNNTITLENNTLTGNQRDTVMLYQAWHGMNLVPQAVMHGYEMAGGFTIPAGYTMTLQAGVTVVADAGVAVPVSGHIESLGTPTLPVTFTSFTNTGYGQWNGLGINGGTAHFQYTIFQYGGLYNNLRSRYSVLTVYNVTHPAGVVLENCTIRNNAANLVTDHAITVEDSIFEMRDSLLTQNGNSAYDHSMLLLGSSQVITLENNILENNQRDTILLGNFWNGMVLNPQQKMHGYELANNFTVPAGQTMSILPGTQVVADNNIKLTVLGHLSALGTPDQPIVFTSFANTGYWQWAGIYVDGGSVALRYATIQYAGQYNGNDESALYLKNILPGNALLEYSNFFNNGAKFQTEAILKLENSTATISNTVFSGNGTDWWDIVLLADSNSHVTLTGSTFQNNTATPIQMPAQALESMTGNAFFANIRNRVIFTGDLTLTKNLNLSTQVGLQGYVFQGNITVPAGKTLSVQPGVTLYWADGKGLTVQGTLQTTGTPEALVIFAADSGASAGRWTGILVDGGEATLEHTLIEYAKTGLLGNDAKLTLKFVQVFDNQNYGIRLTGATRGFYLKMGNISSNNSSGSSYGLSNETGQIVDARLNYWGNANGPLHKDNPTGAGDKVSDLVLIAPWLEAPTQDLGINNWTDGDTTSLAYQPTTGAFSRYYPDGTVVSFNQDGSHAHTLSPDGSELSFNYHSDGSLASLEYRLPGQAGPGWTWTFAYAGRSQVTITDPAGDLTTLTIDDHGDLAQVLYPGGSSDTYAYDDHHRMTQHIGATGAIVSYHYDGYGRVEQVDRPERTVYDPVTGQTSIETLSQNITPSDVGYQLVNGMNSGDPINPAAPLVKPEALISSVQGPSGSVAGHTNRFGAYLDYTNPLGEQTTYLRDAANNILRETTPEGNCFEYTYDENGNMITQSRMGPAQCALTPDQRDPAQVQTWQYTFEPRFNQVKTMNDPEGFTTTYTYDYETGAGNAGNVVKVEHPAVQDGTGGSATPVELYTYNAWGLLETYTDPRATVTKYLYSQGTPAEASGGATPLFALGVSPVPGLLTQVVEDYGDGTHLNSTTTYDQFDARGYPGRISQPGGSNPMTYTYDDYGRVLTETDAAGIVTRYTYDAAGNLVEKIVDYTADPATGRNVTTHYTYDAYHQLTSERTTADGLDNQVSYAYDANGHLVLSRDPLGFETRYIYDAAGQLIEMIDPEGRQTSYTYNVDGLLETETDPAGTITRHIYNGFGQEIQVIVDEGGLGLSTTTILDRKDQILQSTSPGGTAVCRTFDALGRVKTETYDCGGLNLVYSYYYDLAGNQVQATDPGGLTTTAEFDRLNRVVTLTLDPGGMALTIQRDYDDAGNLVSVVDHRGVQTWMDYDLLNRLVEACEDATGMNLCTTYAYDRLGNLAEEMDPQGKATRMTQNAFGVPTQVIEDAGGMNATTTFAYDNALQTTRITDPNGNITQYGYSPSGQVAQVSISRSGGALAQQTTFSYTPLDTLHIRNEYDGATTTHTYDAIGRLVRKDFSTGGNQAFTYHADGWLATANETLGGHTSHLAFEYNALGDMTESVQEVDGHPWMVQYSYNYALREMTTTYPSGTAVKSTLDLLGRVAEIRQDGGAVGTYTYQDTLGNIQLALANGVTEAIETDALGRITVVKTTSTATLADYRYGYNPASRRVSMQRAHLPGTNVDLYQYDGLGQVTDAWMGADTFSIMTLTDYTYHQHYTLDALGNRLEVSYEIPGSTTATPYLPNNGFKLTSPLNQYSQVGTEALGYDLRGNTLSDGVNTFTYDLLNRQTSATDAGGTTTFVYDALGRRVAEISGGTTTYLVYDQDEQVIEERDSADVLVARYIYGEGQDALLKMERGGQVSYLHRDAQNNITEATNASGALVERYTYDIYGEPAFFNASGNTLAGSAIGNRFLYTGQRYDPQTGNYNFRARMYSPALGRFLQMDPLGYVDGWNLYNNYFVINATDPYGTEVPQPTQCPCPDCEMPCNSQEFINKLGQVVDQHEGRQQPSRRGFFRALGRLPVIRQVRIGVRETVEFLGHRIVNILRRSVRLARQVFRETINAMRSEVRNFLNGFGEEMLFETLVHIVTTGKLKGICSFLKNAAKTRVRGLVTNLRGIGQQGLAQLQGGVKQIAQEELPFLPYLERSNRQQVVRDFRTNLRERGRQSVLEGLLGVLGK